MPSGSTPAETPGAGAAAGLVRRVSWPRAGAAIALACILCVAAVLRYDALSDAFGPHTSPRWLGAVESMATRASPLITPDDWGWRHESDPYAGGDPHNYIRFAREMRHFYQAHVREPVFLVVTRAGLFLAGGADVGISLASITSSLLVLVAVYLLGREAVSAGAGLLAAAVVAIDRNVIYWSMFGWRNETFAFFALMAVWLWLRMARRPTPASAVWAGVFTGLACLTRLTAPFMLAPAVLWVLWARDPAVDRQRLKLTLMAGGIAAAIVAPYLINCALTFGDPFYAVNYHTQFYLGREGETPEIVSASSYILGKFAERPFETADIALQGLTTFPFLNKWDGLDAWWPGLGVVLAWLAAAGLTAWLFMPRGRVMLAVLFCSLVPYMITWSIPGGGEWRFTFHAYVFYLLAAFGLVSALARLPRRPPAAARPWRRVALTSAGALLVWGAGLVWWWGMPFFIAREELRQGRQVVVAAGQRDRWQLRAGWSQLVVTGNVTARFGNQTLSEVLLRFMTPQDYQLTLRVDPIPRSDLSVQQLRVWFNEDQVAVLDLTWDPEMVGRYEVVVPGRFVHPGSNVVRLQPDRLVEAGPIRWRYPDLESDDRVGFRFWYLLVRPLEPGAASAPAGPGF